MFQGAQPRIKVEVKVMLSSHAVNRMIVIRHFINILQCNVFSVHIYHFSHHPLPAIVDDVLMLAWKYIFAKVSGLNMSSSSNKQVSAISLDDQ